MSSILKMLWILSFAYCLNVDSICMDSLQTNRAHVKAVRKHLCFTTLILCAPRVSSLCFIKLSTYLHNWFLHVLGHCLTSRAGTIVNSKSFKEEFNFMLQSDSSKQRNSACPSLLLWNTLVRKLHHEGTQHQMCPEYSIRLSLLYYKAEVEKLYSQITKNFET